MTPGAGIYRTQLPQGFTAGGINCGVRRYRPDLGIILSDTDAVVTAVFTQNTCKAAPISYCQSILPASNIKAIVTNSGQANAATGQQGEKHNIQMASAAAKLIGCETSQVLTASTGVIGEPMEIDKITTALPCLMDSVSNISEIFSLAIMTTDLVPKTASKIVTLSQGSVTLTGIAKGSGMIHPNMATMLGYILSDIAITPEQSHHILQKAVNKSFNMISVDGDPSTNDCVFMMNNGQADVTLANPSDEAIFYQAVEELCILLAKAIARDGEGASKLIEVQVSGLDDKALAIKIARSITLSPLIKTAVYGASPNWGRVLAKVGSVVGSEALLSHCQIYMQGHQLIKNGAPVTNVALSALKNALKQDTTVIQIDFSSGKESATAWGCDLTPKYVQINAEYLT